MRWIAILSILLLIAIGCSLAERQIVVEVYSASGYIIARYADVDTVDVQWNPATNMREIRLITCNGCLIQMPLRSRMTYAIMYYGSN